MKNLPKIGIIQYLYILQHMVWLCVAKLLIERSPISMIQNLTPQKLPAIICCVVKALCTRYLSL